MPKDPNEFTQKTKEILAKRANYRCSNPNCSRPTSGPHSENNKSLSIGEAAHIKGGKPGTARFDSEMLSGDRSNINNGIWLCRNCHKLIDNDENRFPAEKLFGWKEQHEIIVYLELSGAAQTTYDVEDKYFDHFSENITLKIREFLFDFVPDNVFDSFCFDYYKSVYKEFTKGMAKSQKIQLLIEHCDRYMEIDQLINNLNNLEPDLFLQFWSS